jgi:outer membrane receptor protein involved in Fe transport
MPILRLTIGGAYQNHFLAEQKKIGGPVPFDNNDPFRVGAAFLTADVFPTPWLKLSLGGRLDAYTDRPQSLSPRIAAVLRPSSRGTLKLIAGRAFRAPSTYEIYYRGQDQLPNPGLSPELCYSFDAEYTHRISSTVTATVESFANVLDKYIAVRPIDASGNQVQFVNLQENLASYGASAEVRRDWRQGWMLAAHGTLQTADYVNAPDRRRVMNFPPYVVSVRGAAPILGRALTLMNRLTINGPRWNRFETETDPPQGKTEAAVLWDAAISGETDEGQWRYIVGLYNVFDWTWSAPTTSDFEPLKAVPQNGRTFMATLSASF